MHDRVPFPAEQVAKVDLARYYDAIAAEEFRIA
jgi:DNA primase